MVPKHLLCIDAKSIDRGFINNELLVGNLLEGLLLFTFRHSSELLFHGCKRSLMMTNNGKDVCFKIFTSKHWIMRAGKGTGGMNIGHRMVNRQIREQ